MNAKQQFLNTFMSFLGAIGADASEANPLYDEKDKLYFTNTQLNNHLATFKSVFNSGYQMGVKQGRKSMLADINSLIPSKE